jgi:hypothetical protein
MVGGGVRLSSGGYTLHGLPNGRTEVTLRTCYVSAKRPRWLWKRIEAAVCPTFHRHILGAMRRTVERHPRAPTACGPPLPSTPPPPRAPDVRAQVVDALRRVAGARPIPALERLLLRDPDAAVRRAAARSLGMLPEAAATSALNCRRRGPRRVRAQGRHLGAPPPRCAGPVNEQVAVSRIATYARPSPSGGSRASSWAG